MSSKKPALRLEDIIEYAGHISEYIGGMDEAAFSKDRRTKDAVERCIERICEAAKKLGDDTKQRLGDHPWRDINDMGNLLRHAYDRAELSDVWKTAAETVPRLAQDCKRVLAQLRSA